MKPGEGCDGFGGRADAPFLDVFEIARGTQRDGVQEFPHLHMVANRWVEADADQAAGRVRTLRMIRSPSR